MAKGPTRSTVTGRYVPPRQANASPRTTVREAPGRSAPSGDHYRSAISGRYVTDKHGRASPHTTIREP